ncbi:TonB-dependent vitamin B12 receptor [Luteimonas terricola]|uniref:TonB-dependent vitamin B12 receptor n=1 Tax=Luteimonas terricola TaxID=645597 RepID=A0ABQ2EM64_9GAMM|nr:TonB-dependent vitamin B12 receptor [Luteimonas terricola]GGK14210.1 TonB-dependent vitamin B12 receptor [Luteimonas terricola]
MKPQYQTLSLAVALALSPMAWAGGGMQATDLDTIVVTATRTAINAEDSNVPVQVLDRAVIERSQASSLLDLLRGRAGINLANQGGPGKLSSLFMRGAESDHVLVLVDGVRIGTASAGMVMFQDLPLDQIERIEIVRGPRSSLYGSEAIGGVIQIFTRRAGSGLRPNVSLGIGSNHHRQASAGIGQTGERGWFQVQGAWQRSEGIDSCRGTAEGWGAGCFADEPDRDGYRNASVSLRGGRKLGETVDVEGHALVADAFNEYDGSVFGGNESDNRQQVLGGHLRWRPNDRADVNVRIGRADDKADNHFFDHASGVRSFASNFGNRRNTGSVQGDLAVDDEHLLSAGVDWLRDEVTSSTAFTVDSRDNTGVFLAYQGSFDAHSVEASVRHDDNEQFGGHATGSVGYGFKFGNGFRFTASAGTGFKVPTFNDLYYPGGWGNPELQPEESRTLNLGIAQFGKGWNWTFNAFQTDIDDLIGYDTDFALLNVDEARIRGAELTGFASLAGWDVNAEISHIDPRNQSAGSNHGNWLPRRSRSTARVDVDRGFGDFRFGVSGFGSGARHDDAANLVRLPGYGTVDLRLEYAISSEWTLQARVTNVFDREYETIAWYNQPGREYGLTLRYRAGK